MPTVHAVAVSIRRGNMGLFIIARFSAVWLGATACGAMAACSATTGTSSGVHDNRVQEQAIWMKPAGGCPIGTSEGRTTCAACDMARPAECSSACKSGDSSACVVLGYAYAHGAYDSIDYSKSLALFERGCSLGSVEACEGVGRQRLRGEGCAKDETAALEILERVCRTGRGTACTLAGDGYEARGMDGDTAAGLRLVQEGCVLGSIDGCRRVAERCRRASTDGSTCVDRARERACALGDAESCGTLRTEGPTLRQE